MGQTSVITGSKRITWAVGFAIAAIIVCQSDAAAADGGQYISQSYVDTVVQNAFNNFNNADDLAGTGMTRERAIAEAKLTIKRLRRLAETDPNKKYILWKVGELESHVYLEEEGLLMDRQRQQQKAANELVPSFNSETGRPRPDFGQLWRIQVQMSALNPGKGDELDALICDRARNIAREAVASCERAADDGDLDKARRELAYIKIQQEHLGVSQTRYTQLAARVQSKVTVDGELAYIKGGFQKIDEQTAILCLGEARRIAAQAGLRLDGVRSMLIKPEWDRLDGRLRGLNGRIASREDSLVNAGLAILKKGGISAAKEFLEKEIRPTEMLAEKISRVETEVLRVAAAAHAAQDTAMRAEFASLYQGGADGGVVMADMMAEAKRKSRAKRDSVAAVPDAQKGATTQIEEVRRERANIALANRQDRAVDQAQPDDKRGLSQIERLRRERGQLAQAGAQERTETVSRENREKAEKEMVAIYTLLEQKKVKDAFGEFRTEADFLKKYLSEESYRSLDSAVTAQNRKK